MSLHLRSDVAIAASLSGGIDSSSIVSVMRHLDPRMTIHAFSYIADDPAVSEERWVDLIGAGDNLVVHKVKLSTEALVDDLENLVALQGECFRSTSIYAQRRLFQHASDAGVKVMLDGQGADEIFGGYQNHIAARFASLLCQGHFAEAVRIARGRSRLQHSGLWPVWLRSLDFLVPSSAQVLLRRFINEEFMPSWLNSKWFEDRGVNYRRPNYQHAEGLLRDVLHDSLTEGLPALLRYADRNSMRSSLESRVPFLLPTLVQFVLALPEEYIIASDGTTKAIFRKAMRHIVPDRILDRTDKIGFETPEKRWLLTLRPWVEKVLASETAMHLPAIDGKEMRQEWRDMVAGNKRFNSRAWRWVNTLLWIEKFAVEVD